MRLYQSDSLKRRLMAATGLLIASAAIPVNSFAQG